MASDATDQQALLELVQRLLIQPYPDAPTGVELLPGRLPPDRSDAFPLPEGGRLLGSAIYRRNGSTTSIEAVVDLAMPSGPAVRAYEEQLRQAGWTPFGLHGGGFMMTQSGIPRSYRHRQGGPALVVNTFERDRHASAFRLRLDWEIPKHVPRPQPGMELMPMLLAPPDVEIEGGGTTGSDSSLSSAATAHTTLPPRELETYLAQQLTAASWTRIGGAATDVLAWSAWNVPGPGSWIGLLLVVAFEGGDCALSVHIQAPIGRQPRSTAWLSRRRAWWRRFSVRGFPRT